MADPTLKETRKALAEMESTVRDLFREFETVHGVMVDGMDIRRTYFMDGGNEIIDVKFDISIET